MKKNSIVMLVAVALMLMSSPGYAQVDFFVEAELPASDDATFTVSKVFVGPPLVFVPTPTFSLDFGVLELDTVNGIWLPDGFFWVIDIGSNAVGMPDIAVAYTDTANPNGGLNNGTGLGGRATINFAEVVTNPDLSQTTNNITTVALGQVNTIPGGIDETEYEDGFLRASVGIFTGENPIAGASPFTGLDNPGLYAGTLTLTATFD